MDMLALAGAFGTFAFFAGVALCNWVDQRGKARQRDLEHTERMKALEVGQPLPDAEVARARAESVRSQSAAAVAICVPLVMVLAATFTTIVGVTRPEGVWSYLPLLIVVWAVTGLVSVITVRLSLVVLRRRGPAVENYEDGPHAANQSAAAVSESSTRFSTSENLS
jgi:hypothetical protein